MNDEPVDLSPLDPTRDSARFNATVRAIASAAMDARSARAIKRADIFTDLASWSLARAVGGRARARCRHPGIDVRANAIGDRTRSGCRRTDVLGIPRELTDLLSSRQPVSLTDLHAALASATHDDDSNTFMTLSSSRLRALALLALSFGVGGVAGVAIDRTWLRPAAEPPRAEARRQGTDRSEVDADQIPFPLEALKLNADEERRLHEIARRWRPQAAQAMEGMRSNISELENNMFAEMLCALSKEKQDRYLAQLQENGADAQMIEKRFRLVRSNQCAEVRRGETPRR